VKRHKPSILFLPAIVAVLAGCYQDAVYAPDLQLGITYTYLTDAPFPANEVRSVEVYVVDVAASTVSDTTLDSRPWVSLATPRSRFDLMQLQQGRLALLGDLNLTAGVYRAIRITIDSDSSNVTFSDGSVARVLWPNQGHIAIPVVVEAPLEVTDGGAVIVVDFDLALSFTTAENDPNYDFLFEPTIRAVNAAFTGSISGIINGKPGGDGVSEPLVGAAITVFRYETLLPTDSLIPNASTYTDSTGFYRVGFLLPGFYTVQVDTPDQETFGGLLAHDVEVFTGENFIFSVTLPANSAAWNPLWR